MKSPCPAISKVAAKSLQLKVADFSARDALEKLSFAKTTVVFVPIGTLNSPLRFTR